MFGGSRGGGLGEEVGLLRLGGGGGALLGSLSPWNGGGTPNLVLGSLSSSMGVLGGLGGGGGPGFARVEDALCLVGSVGGLE